jgi:hypothetical protein
MKKVSYLQIISELQLTNLVRIESKNSVATIKQTNQTYSIKLNGLQICKYINFISFCNILDCLTIAGFELNNDATTYINEKLEL